MKTWVIEAGLIALLLGAVVGLTGSQSVEWLGAIAVLLTFMHGQVGFRMSEAEDRRAALEREVRSLSQRYEHAADKPPLEVVQSAEAKLVEHVECYRWMARYFIAKELCWLGYFSMHGAWPALVGVGAFLIYPAWRRFHRRGSTDQKPA